MKMVPCRYLDYSKEKYDFDLVVMDCAPHFPDVRYWFRGPRWTDNGPYRPPSPSEVQFCTLRGRINGIFQCYQTGEMSCYRPEEGQNVEVVVTGP